MKNALESFFTGFEVDAECGDVQGAGWYGLVRGSLLTGTAPEGWSELSDDDRAALVSCAGVIIGEDSQGFIDVRIIDDGAELDSEWARIEAEVEAFEASIDE